MMAAVVARSTNVLLLLVCLISSSAAFQDYDYDQYSTPAHFNQVAAFRRQTARQTLADLFISTITPSQILLTGAGVSNIKVSFLASGNS